MLFPRRPVKLEPFKIPCFLQIAKSLKVRILVSIFLAVSISTIGLVLARSPPHSLFFEMGYILLCFQVEGVVPMRKQV